MYLFTSIPSNRILEMIAHSITTSASLSLRLERFVVLARAFRCIQMRLCGSILNFVSLDDGEYEYSSKKLRMNFSLCKTSV